MRKRPSRLLVLAAAAVALVGACSSDDTSGGQPVIEAAADVKAGPPVGWDSGGYEVDPASLKCSDTGSNPTRGITDTEIKVGGLAYLTSPNGSSMVGADVGAKVRFQRANDSGGVHGRTINFIGTLDDGNDPARNGQQAQALAQQEQVFAVVPLLTSHTSYLDSFCKEGVPFFGWGFNPGYCGAALGFGITGCQFPQDKVRSTLYGVTISAMFDGDVEGRTTALVGVDNDSARAGLLRLKNEIEAVGIDVVYAENPIPLTGLTDATAIVNEIMKSNKGGQPDVVLIVGDFNPVVKLTEALNAAGYTGKHLNPVGYDPRLAGFESLQNTYTILQWQPGIDTDVPAIRQMADDFAKYAPGETISLPAMAAYWSADMFLDAIEKAGPDLTVDSLISTLNSGEYSYYVEGAVPETRWPLNHNVNAPCGAVTLLQNQEYTIVSDLVCGSMVKLD